MTISNCIISERAEGPACIFNSPKLPASLTVTKSLLPEWCKSIGGDNLFTAPAFVMSGSEPYLLTDSSPAVGVASGFDASSKDVAGRVRLRNGKADLGAFAFAPGGSTNLPY